MKQLNRILISFVLVLSLTFTVSLPVGVPVQANDAVQITDEDFIKADGKVLKTKAGEEIVLKGTNAGGYLLQEIWMTLTKETNNIKTQEQIISTLKSRFPNEYQTLLNLYEDKYWSESDFDNCKELGMNVIRLPFWHKNLLDDSGNMKSNAFDRMDWFITEAGKRGMYVILDMHGVPGSQNAEHHSGDASQGVSFFQGNNASKNQQTAIDLWKKTAEHYRGNPIVAGYDLLNEPYTSENEKITTRTVWDYYDKAYKAIREVDTDHIVIMEATWEPENLPRPAQYGWENVMYEYHCYNYGDQLNAQAQLEMINKKLARIDRTNYNVPSYIGETSFFGNMDSWRACLQRLNDYGISWTTWTYKTTYRNNSWGIFNQVTEEADLENDSYNTIYSKWSKAGECIKNEELYSVIYKYLNQKSSITESGEGRYEAESVDEFINGGAIRTMTKDFGKFSNDSYVEDMNGNSSDNMDTAKCARYGIKVSKAGTYIMNIGYATTTDTKFGVRINNDDWMFRTVDSTGAWSNVGNISLEVQLNEGYNEIRLSGSVDVAESWIILDYFELNSIDEVATGETGLVNYPSAIGRHEAEDADSFNMGSVNGTQTIEENENFSGGKSVGNLNAWSEKGRAYLVKKVNANTAGIYKMTIAYAGATLGNEPTIDVRVNNGEWKSTKVIATAGWNTTTTITTEVELVKGENALNITGACQVRYSKNQAWQWVNLDYFEIDSLSGETTTQKPTETTKLPEPTEAPIETTTKSSEETTKAPIETTTNNQEESTQSPTVTTEMTTPDEVTTLAEVTTAGGETTTASVETTTTADNVQINVIKVKRAKIKSVKKISRTKAKIKLKKIKNAKGYQIRYGTKKKLTKKIKKVRTKKLKFILKKLKVGKKYYLQARAYTIVNGKKKYGKWSKKRILKK